MTWNPFNRSKNEQETQSQEHHESDTRTKSHPTPKRKVAQASNLRPLVPADRKASAKAARERIRKREDEQYEAMRRGDIANMPASERLPWRVYIRDYVDARFNLGEWFLPVAFVIMILSLVFSAIFPQLMIPTMLLLYVYLFAVLIDTWWMWHELKAKLVEKFGEQSVARGSRSGTYAWSRAVQLRRWRLPKPRTEKRGNWPK